MKHAVQRGIWTRSRGDEGQKHAPLRGQDQPDRQLETLNRAVLTNESLIYQRMGEGG
jgi:hypothetical protein